ncbi:Hypothetical_protein [Hexamita inflata]|uniref:Hypothetical_protein n=1 Tax=Hexamita inflata TaxID=28002 RepID=A0AA86THR4_9EUKA|nr:Hypothetical protein HINF_LOCUS5610 [Hexamita inflata]
MFFESENYNLSLLSGLVQGVNKLFKEVLPTINIEDVILHYESSIVENVQYGSALNLWYSRLEGNPSVQSIIDFLRVCEVILVSECSVEQVFSQFGNIIGQRRTLLSPQMLHATYMVKSCKRRIYEANQIQFDKRVITQIINNNANSLEITQTSSITSVLLMYTIDTF